MLAGPGKVEVPAVHTQAEPLIKYHRSAVVVVRAIAPMVEMLLPMLAVMAAQEHRPRFPVPLFRTAAEAAEAAQTQPVQEQPAAAMVRLAAVTVVQVRRIVAAVVVAVETQEHQARAVRADRA